MATNPFEQLVEERANAANNTAAAVPATNPFVQLEQDRQDAQLRTMVQQAQQFDPDLYARASALAPGNLPPEFVVNHVDMLDRRAVTQGYIDFFKQNPRIRAWAMSDPEALRTIKPDELRVISSVGDLFGVIGTALHAGSEQLELSQLGLAGLYGTATPQQLARLNELQNTVGSSVDYQNWIVQGVAGTFEQAPQLLHNAVAGVEAAAVGMIVGAGVGGLTGGPAGAATGALAMAGPSFLTGTAWDIYLLTAGAAFSEFMNFKDENGQPLDPAIARVAAWAVAAPSALLDVAGLGAVVRNIPGVNTATGALFKNQMQVALRNPGVRAALANFARETGIAAGAEVTTEVLQEMLQMTAGELAKGLSGQPFQPATQDQWIARIQQTFGQMTQIMSIMGPVVNLPMLVGELREARTSTLNNERIRQVYDTLQTAKEAIARDPNRVAAAINAATLNSQVYLQEEELSTFFQEAGLDINDVAAPGWAETLANARAGDGIIQMSLGDFLAHLVKDPEDNPILDMVRGTPDGFAPNELKDLADQYITLLRGEPPQRSEGAPDVSAAPVEPPPLSPQALDIQAQFEAAAVEGAAAENYARLLDSFVNTMSDRLGMKPEEIWNRVALQIQRGGTGAISPDALLQEAWHGSGSIFERFDLKYLGTGEGAQAFGYGLYFAQDRGIATGYRNKLSKRNDFIQLGDTEIKVDEAVTLGGLRPGQVPKGVDPITWRFVRDLDFSSKKTVADLVKFIEEENGKLFREIQYNREVAAVFKDEPGSPERLHRDGVIGKLEEQVRSNEALADKYRGMDQAQPVGWRKSFSGRLFKVDVPENPDLMVWDATEQFSKVRKAMEDIATELGFIDEYKVTSGKLTFYETGEWFYRHASAALAKTLREEQPKLEWSKASKMADKELSLELLRRGVIGHRFLDANTRAQKQTIEQEAAELILDHMGGNREAAMKEYGIWENGEFQRWDTEKIADDDAIANDVARLWEDDPGSKYQSDDELLIAALQLIADDADLQPAMSWNFVIYDDNAVKVTEFFQDAKGSIQFFPDETAIINLFEKADLSTPLHEFGHLFLQTFVKLAQGVPNLQADLAFLQKELGFTGDKITRKAHEKFARSFESYLKTGEAPSAELQGIFNRFRAWLLGIYLKVAKKLPKVSPELKEIFDRMLATEEQISKKTKLREYELKTMEELGLDEEAYKIYSDHVTKLRNQAQNNLQRSYVGDSFRWFEGWMAKVLDGIKAEIRTKLTTDENSPYYKLDKADKLLAKDPTMDQDLVAKLTGFESKEQMDQVRANLPSLNDTVTINAHDEMRRRYGMGDLDKADTLDVLAASAMHTDARTTVLGTELKALWAKGGKTLPTNALQLARNVAKASVRRAKIGTILSGYKFLSGFQRAGRAADRAILKGDYEEAARQKRKQLITQEMIREGNEVRKEIERTRKKALRFSNPKRFPKDIDPAYADQIRALVAQFDFTSDAKRTPPASPLPLFVQKATQEGDVLEIDPKLFNMGKIPFPQLTLEELEGVIAAIDSLEHAGRRANQVRVEGELKAAQAQIQRVLDQLGKLKAVKRFNTPGKITRFFNTGNAALTKAESLIKELDGGDVNGPLTQLVMRPLQEGQAAVNTDMQRVLKPLTDKAQALGRTHLQHQFEIKALGKKDGQPQYKSKNEILSIILTAGTDAGYARIRKLGISEQAYNEMITHLEPKDIEFANYVWDAMSEFKDKINARMARITGVKPSSITQRPYLDLKGGWIPLTLDYASTRVVSKKNSVPYFDQDAIQAALQTQDVDTDAPLLFDLDALKNRVHDLIWAVNMREPIKQAKKVLFEPRVNSMLEQIVGRAQTEGFKGYLKYLGNEMTAEPLTSGVNKVIDHLRIGGSAMSLGFNIGTALMQPLGITGSMEEVGVGWILGGLRDAILHPQKYAEVRARSEFMNNRMNNVERDLQRNYQQAIQGKVGLKVQQVLNFAHQFIGFMDKMVAIPTWIGAYNKQLKATPNDEAAAIYAADRAVRLSQGSAAPADLAFAVRQPGLMKWFTMYFTWLSALYNQMARLGKETVNARKPKDIISVLARWSVLVIVPALINNAFNNFRFEDDDNEGPWEENLKAIVFYPMSTIPGLRDLVSAVNGFEFKQTPVASFFESLTRVITQTSSIIAGDPDPNWRRLYGDAIQIAGTAFHLPLRPLKNLGLDWFEQNAEQGEVNLLELLKGQI